MSKNISHADLHANHLDRDAVHNIEAILSQL